CSGWRKMYVEQGSPAIDQLLARAHVRRERIDNRRGQRAQRLMHDHTLHLRRQRAGLLINRHDTPGMQRLIVGLPGGFPVAIRLEDFVLRILHLHAVRGELEPSEENHSLMRMEDVVQEWLVEEDGPQRAGVIADEHFKNLETRPARRTNPTRD